MERLGPYGVSFLRDDRLVREDLLLSRE